MNNANIMNMLKGLSGVVHRHDEAMSTLAIQLQSQQAMMAAQQRSTERAIFQLEQAEAERERAREAQRVREAKEREELDRVRSANLVDEVRRLLAPPRPVPVEVVETIAPIPPPTPAATTVQTFNPREVPDTAPRPNYNFNFQLPSATRARPIPTASVSFEHASFGAEAFAQCRRR